MPNCKSVYDPQEDSTLLETQVKKYAYGDVLDMGTGSGLQALGAAQKGAVRSVLAVDIQKDVIDYCKKTIPHTKITFTVSDLFSKLKTDPKRKHKQFDTIIFNPPYLPQELKVRDLTLEGGKKGYEVIERFLSDVNRFLKKEGIILLLFSSLTKKSKVEEFIKNNLLEFKKADQQHIFFEDLFVYTLRKSDILKKLESKSICDVHYFAKGKRGFVFTGFYKGKKVGIKVENPKSKAINKIQHEVSMLKKVNKRNIGPKLQFSAHDSFVYEFVEGIPFVEYLEKSSKPNIKKVIQKIMNQLFVMDQMGINKEEMSHPTKHILITNKGEPVLIDFERAHFAAKPSNVTQFCDYLVSRRIEALLKSKNIELNKSKVLKAAQSYKQEPNEANVRKIIKD